MKCFLVADLTSHGELRRSADYGYEQLERVPSAADLIVSFSTILWREPDEFEQSLGDPSVGITFRWRSCAPTAGIGTLRCNGELVSLSLLASGIEPDADRITLAAFQQHLLASTRDTPFEPAFALLDLNARPMVATIEFHTPSTPDAQYLLALVDRCFAAAYFRRLGLV